MAEGALRHSHAQLAVSITGIAGPGGSEHKPEGRVCFGARPRTVMPRDRDAAISARRAVGVSAI